IANEWCARTAPLVAKKTTLSNAVNCRRMVFPLLSPHGTHAQRACRCNANIVVEAGRKPRPLKERCPPMAPGCLLRPTEIAAHPVFTAARGRSRRPPINFYQERVDTATFVTTT